MNLVSLTVADGVCTVTSSGGGLEIGSVIRSGANPVKFLGDPPKAASLNGSGNRKVGQLEETEIGAPRNPRTDEIHAEGQGKPHEHEQQIRQHVFSWVIPHQYVRNPSIRRRQKCEHRVGASDKANRVIFPHFKVWSVGEGWISQRAEVK